MAKKPTARRTVSADDTPETKATKAEKQAAAEEQFAKADAAGSPDKGELNVRLSALGY